MDGELRNWGNLNLDNFEDEYSDEEEGTDIINSGPSRENKKDTFRLNKFYLYLDTCSKFNQNINKITVQDIQKVVKGIKSHRNRCVRRTNQKGNYSGFLGYLKTWFHTNGLGNIL